MQEFDVIVVGYGPTGKLLARLLSDAGHSVAIIERWPAAYPLPRAVAYDHEIKRLMHKLGIAEDVAQISLPIGKYVWFNADWKTLVEIDQSVESISGGPVGYFFNQPDLERILEADLAERDGITTFLSHEALSLTQTESQAAVTIAPFEGLERGADTSKSKTITAKYVVGCDGANSIVRKTMDCDVTDHGFDFDWLVVDVLPNEGASLDIPHAAQWCNPARPTTIVGSGVKHRRWEFMLLPGEDPVEFAKEDNVWRLLSPWMTPEDGSLVRSATYNFRSLLARGWRQKRMLIAGDAAHLMPPFMGQGMCSGLRDALDLGWKLVAVLDQRAPDSLLDDYEAERAPQVDAVINISMQMGQVICVPDPQAAAARDEAFFSGQVPPPPAFPGLIGGMIDADGAGAPKGLAGALLPHDEVTLDGKVTRLDDLRNGFGFMLLVNGLSHDALTAEAAEALRKLDCLVVPFGLGEYTDVNGRLTQMFETSGAKAVLMRPDFYAYGSAETAKEAEALLVKAAAHFTAS